MKHKTYARAVVVGLVAATALQIVTLVLGTPPTLVAPANIPWSVVLLIVWVAGAGALLVTGREGVEKASWTLPVLGVIGMVAQAAMLVVFHVPLAGAYVLLAVLTGLSIKRSLDDERFRVTHRLQRH
jgi:hypothetical protein